MEVRQEHLPETGMVDTMRGGTVGHEAVPGRLILKLKPGLDETEKAAAEDRLRAISSRFQMIEKRPLLEPFLGAWAKEEGIEGFDTRSHASWYWYQGDEEWMKNEAPDPALPPARTAAADALETFRLQEIQLLKFPETADVAGAARLFSLDPAVQYAHPDYIVKTQWVPNDRYYNTSGAWGQPFRDLWGLVNMAVEQAWDQSRGAGVVVAVSDTGVDYGHEDLAANIWTNPGETGFDALGRDKRTNGVDDDGNGFVDDWRGYDFVSFDDGVTDNDPMDDHGHGTHVAGTIAAVGNNSVGIVGVAPSARIMPVKGLDRNGSGATSDLAAGIVYAAQNGASVLNASWGPGVPAEAPGVLADAVDFAHSRGMLVVAAAGNSRDDVGTPERGYYPASLRNVVAISAMDHLDQIASFSNFGSKIDAGAPGGGDAAPSSIWEPGRSILSALSSQANPLMTGNGQLVVGSRYMRQAGTSMAAPHAAGVAALIRALRPALSIEQVRQALRAGSNDVGAAGFDLQSGYGRLNALRSLALAAPLAVRITSPAGGIIEGLQSITVEGQAAGTGLVRWELHQGAGILPTGWTLIASGSSQRNGTLAAWDIRSVADGPRTIRLTALHSGGQVYEDRVSVMIDQVRITDPAPAPEGEIWWGPTPRNILRPGAVVSIRGTAAPAQFSRYRLVILRPDGTQLQGANIALAHGGSSAVRGGLLGTWSTGGVPAGHYQVRVDVTLTAGQVITELGGWVGLDPTLHPGWPVYLGPNTVGNHPPIMYHLTAVDMNGDGASDLVVSFGDTIRVFNHSGNPVPGWPQPNGGGFSQTGPAVGDLDGDGSPEVVAYNIMGDSKVRIFRSNGALVPGWPRYISPAMKIAIDDIDGNGAREVITTDGAGIINVFDIQGNMLPGWPTAMSGVSLLSAPAIGDVDRDGRKEIAVVELSAPCRLALYQSNGRMMAGWPQQIAPNSPGSYFPHSDPAMGDLDGDGDLEIVVASGEGKVYAFHHTGAAVAGWPRAVSSRSLNSVILGDMNGDNRPEVVVGGAAETQAGPFRIWENLHVLSANGAPVAGWPRAWSPDRHPEWLSSWGFHAACMADIDGVPGQEVISSSDVNLEYPMAMTAFNAAGGLVSGFPKVTRTVGASPISSGAIADVDGDGYLELAWIDDDYWMYLWDLPGRADVPAQWPMARHDPAHTGRWEVPRINRIPELNPIGNRSLYAGDTLTFTVSASASDPDGDALTFSAANLPARAAFDAAQRRFSWPSAAYQAGTYPGIRFSMTDGTDTRSETLTLTVNSRPTPWRNPVNSRDVNANGTVEAQDALLLISNLSHSGSRRLPAPTPSFYPPPYLDVSGDGYISPIDVLQVVNALNNPGITSIENRQIQVGQTLSFQVQGRDPDGCALTYSAPTRPPGAGFNPANRTFTWTPSSSHVGSHTARFEVTDGVKSAAQQITVTVLSGNRPPVIYSARGYAWLYGWVYFRVSASDPDGDSLTYRWTMGDGRARSGNYFWYRYPSNKRGWRYVTVRATDSKGASVSRSFWVYVR